MTFTAVATFSAAIILTSCNNAEQVKKQVEEQNAKIQSAVDEQLNGLNEEVNTACAATVDSLATIAFDAWQAEEAKAHKGKKPTPKPAPKPKETTKVDPKNPKQDRFDNPDGAKTVTKEQTDAKGDRFKDPNAPKTVTPEDTKKKGDRFKTPQ